MKDLKSNLKTIVATAPVAVGAGPVTSDAIDLKGHESALLQFHYGAIAATGGTLTVTILEGDTTGGGFTSVADAHLVGTEADASIPAGARVAGVNSAVSKSIGYIGEKRYIKGQITNSGVATTVPIAISAALGNARKQPVS